MNTWDNFYKTKPNRTEQERQDEIEAFMQVTKAYYLNCAHCEDNDCQGCAPALAHINNPKGIYANL